VEALDEFVDKTDAKRKTLHAIVKTSEAFVSRFSVLLETREALPETSEAFVESSEAFVESSDAFTETSKALVDAPGSFLGPPEAFAATSRAVAGASKAFVDCLGGFTHVSEPVAEASRPCVERSKAFRQTRHERLATTEEDRDELNIIVGKTIKPRRRVAVRRRVRLSKGGASSVDVKGLMLSRKTRTVLRSRRTRGPGRQSCGRARTCSSACCAP
jgi:hypothetical protein